MHNLQTAPPWSIINCTIPTQNYILSVCCDCSLVTTQVKELARELHTRHFSAISLADSVVTSELGRLVQDITAACQAHEQDVVSYCTARNI